MNVIVYKRLLFTSIRQLIIDASEEEKTLDLDTTKKNIHFLCYY